MSSHGSFYHMQYGNDTNYLVTEQSSQGYDENTKNFFTVKLFETPLAVNK